MKKAKYTPDDLRAYQWRAIKFSLKRFGSALFLDMGLGKTIVTLSVIRAWMHRLLVTKVLLVAPIRPMYSVWRQEAQQWSHTRRLSFSVVHGTALERMDALEAEADIYIINPENLAWLIEYLRHDKKYEWPFDALIIDESSMFKAAGSKRFRRLRYVVKRFKRRVILSGTPTPNSLTEIWPQMFIVDKGKRLGTSSKRFKQRFFQEDDPYSDYPKLVPRKNSEKYLYNLIGDVALSMEAKDYLKDLPPTVNNIVTVQLPPRARRIYEKLEKEMFLQLDLGDVDAVTRAVLIGKCHQVANGAIYSMERETNTKIWEEIHSVKVDAVREIVSETGSPVLIAYWYKHDFYRLREEFPTFKFFKKSKNDKTERQWNNGDIDGLLCHYRNAAHGMNLQYGPGHTLALFSLTWSEELREQIISRVGNARAQRRVMVHHIKAENTTDDAIMISRTIKSAGQKKLINALKEYRNAKSL